VSGFIQVHEDGKELLFNTAFIVQVSKSTSRSGVDILTTSGYACSVVRATESYNQVKKLIEGSQK
jgi:hypothetical protein